ncbi:hypothetical protein HZA38_04990 [Candidatus Peregrinibacteria bacterium]|nr:hypothetical protein [Candidatus Peregrinibacteria bacterium]
MEQSKVLPELGFAEKPSNRGALFVRILQKLQLQQSWVHVQFTKEEGVLIRELLNKGRSCDDSSKRTAPAETLEIGTSVAPESSETAPIPPGDGLRSAGKDGILRPEKPSDAEKEEVLRILREAKQDTHLKFSKEQVIALLKILGDEGLEKLSERPSLQRRLQDARHHPGEIMINWINAPIELNLLWRVLGLRPEPIAQESPSTNGQNAGFFSFFTDFIAKIRSKVSHV